VLSVAVVRPGRSAPTHSSWPLAHARTLLVALAALCYFASYVVRARGWRRLFPPEERPDQSRCCRRARLGQALHRRRGRYRDQLRQERILG
jgi:hypothetical protein